MKEERERSRFFIYLWITTLFVFSFLDGSAIRRLRTDIDALKANVRTLMEDKERAMVAETIREHLVITPKEPDNERK